MDGACTMQDGVLVGQPGHNGCHVSKATTGCKFEAAVPSNSVTSKQRCKHRIMPKRCGEPGFVGHHVSATRLNLKKNKYTTETVCFGNTDEHNCTSDTDNLGDFPASTCDIVHEGNHSASIRGYSRQRRFTLHLK